MKQTIVINGCAFTACDCMHSVRRRFSEGGTSTITSDPIVDV